jgi:DUF4097 and DUF4098 domain-containing protein YvlB
MMSNPWKLFATALGALALAAPALPATSFSKQVPVDPNGRLRISNVSGDISITAWDRREVDVQGELGTGVERVDVNAQGDGVEVRVILKDRDWQHSNGWRDGEARLQIKVPATVELDASTVSGSIRASGMRGEQRLKSVSGDIRSDGVGTDVNATTVSGRVELTGTGKEAHVRATSVSGDVRLNRMSGDIEARSTSGSVDVDAIDASDVRVGVVSGSLSLRGSLSREADVDLNAVSGRVRVAVQTPAGFRYDVSSFSGSIRNCFGAEMESSDPTRRGWSPGTRFRGERGEGKATLRARSHSGSVDICDR